jgi:hypothetical protein
MNDLDLARRLRVLRRTVLMLQTELRQGHMDDALVADVDQQLEHGIGTEPRCTHLPHLVDAVRENAMGMGPERFADTIRSCEKLSDAIEGVMSALR